MAEESGMIPVLGHRLFYRSFGQPTSGRTVLGVHGGPGACHDYLLPFADLAKQGVRVVLFDQLGCGASEVPKGTSLFSLEHHVEEVEAVRAALGLGQVDLIGSSYGGLLAIAVALRRPGTLRSLTTVGGLASVPLTVSEMNRLRGNLPEATRRVLDRCEAAGTTESAEYQEACMTFYRRHLCRLDPWPPEVVRTMELMAQRPVYRYMNGPSEFTITGTIRDVDLSGQLGKIRLPTLVLGGKHDEVTPVVAAQIRDGIPGARGVTFEGSSHMPFWEERGRFGQVVGDFLGSLPT